MSSSLHPFLFGGQRSEKKASPGSSSENDRQGPLTFFRPSACMFTGSHSHDLLMEITLVGRQTGRRERCEKPKTGSSTSVVPLRTPLEEIGEMIEMHVIPVRSSVGGRSSGSFFLFVGGPALIVLLLQFILHRLRIGCQRVPAPDTRRPWTSYDAGS